LSINNKQVCDENCIWRISGAIPSQSSQESGSSQTVKVSLIAGSQGDDGAEDGHGTDASFAAPVGICINPLDDSLFICDFDNQNIRMINNNGDVTTLVGKAPRRRSDNTPGRIDDGEDEGVTFRSPYAITMDTSSLTSTPSGIFYITDADHIRRMTITPLPSYLIAALRELSTSSNCWLPDDMIRIIVSYIKLSIRVECIAGTKYDDGASEDNNSGSDDDGYDDNDTESDSNQRLRDARLGSPRSLCILPLVRGMNSSSNSVVSNLNNSHLATTGRREKSGDVMTYRLIIGDCGRHRLASIQLPLNNYLVPAPSGTPPFTVSRIGWAKQLNEKQERPVNSMDPIAWCDLTGVLAVSFDTVRQRLWFICGEDLWLLKHDSYQGKCIHIGRVDDSRHCLVDPITGHCIVPDYRRLLLFHDDGTQQHFAGSSPTKPAAVSAVHGHRLSASFGAIGGCTIDTNGSIYVCDRSTIRRIDSQTGVVTTIGGNGKRAVVDGFGRMASFASPSSIAIDIHDNNTIYVCDGDRIRVITRVHGRDKNESIDGEYYVSTLVGTKTHHNDPIFDGIGPHVNFKDLECIVYDSNSYHNPCISPLSTFYLSDGECRIRQLTVIHDSALQPLIAPIFLPAPTASPSSSLSSTSSNVSFPFLIERLIIDYVPERCFVITVAGKPAAFKDHPKVNNKGTDSIGSRQLQYDGIGTNARFVTATSLTIDPHHRMMYVADNENGAIRTIVLPPSMRAS
jgi:hypothetical protein